MTDRPFLVEVDTATRGLPRWQAHSRVPRFLGGIQNGAHQAQSHRAVRVTQYGQLLAAWANGARLPDSELGAGLSHAKSAELGRQRHALALVGVPRHGPAEAARRAQRRGQANRQPKAGNTWCTRCSVKYAQAAGLCRSCGRETGAYEKTTREADADRIARQQVAVPAVTPPSPRAPRTRAIDGVEFEVVFDGTRDGR